MKKSILMVAVMAAFTFFSCKDNAADKVKDENVATAAERDADSGKFPVMKSPDEEFDCGTIDQGTHVEHTFRFTNTGYAPLTIADAKRSCGCTVRTATVTPLKPSASGEPLVKSDWSGQNQVTKTISVTSNTQEGTEQLRIKAFVNPKNPTSTVN